MNIIISYSYQHDRISSSLYSALLSYSYPSQPNPIQVLSLILGWILAKMQDQESESQNADGNVDNLSLERHLHRLCREYLIEIPENLLEHQQGSANVNRTLLLTCLWGAKLDYHERYQDSWLVRQEWAASIDQYEQSHPHRIRLLCVGYIHHR